MPSETAVSRQIDDLFSKLEDLLKDPDASEALAEKGVNTSLAMLAVDGLKAYLKGEKAQAAEDLSTAGEEIASRMAMSGESS